VQEISSLLESHVQKKLDGRLQKRLRVFSNICSEDDEEIQEDKSMKGDSLFSS
jgi:hypothetical protein